MSDLLDHYINGTPAPSNSRRFGDIINPATNQVIGQVPFATSTEINTAIAAAKTALPAWSATSPLKRARILFKLKQLLEEHTEALAEIVTKEHGKVLEDARGSVARGIEVVEYFCGIPELLKGDYSENVATDVDCYTIKQPVGVCLGITPFNFPVMIPLWMLVPAIACGNTFILKPSEQDPSASMLIAKLLTEAGVPGGVVNIVHGDKPIVDELLEHPDIKAVSFVGSSTVAKAVYEKAILHGKRAQAFGSAKNHAIVMPDADLDEAAKAITAAGYGSAGERCMALTSIICVGDDTAAKLISKLKPLIAAIKVAEGTTPQADMGPLISAAHRDRVLQHIEDAINQGAKLLIDGRGQIDSAGHFIGPCLFDAVTADMPINQTEIFGPVLSILRVDDFNAALTIINDHPFGNGTCLFTQSGELAREFAHRVQVGMVGINVPIPVPVAYHTFGGWKQSFFGDNQLHSTESVHFYTKQKSITQRWPRSQTTTSFAMPTN